MSWFCNHKDLLDRIEQIEFESEARKQPLRVSVGISAYLPKTFYDHMYCCHAGEVEKLLGKMKDDGIDIEKYHIYLEKSQ